MQFWVPLEIKFHVKSTNKSFDVVPTFDEYKISAFAQN